MNYSNIFKTLKELSIDFGEHEAVLQVDTFESKKDIVYKPCLIEGKYGFAINIAHPLVNRIGTDKELSEFISICHLNTMATIYSGFFTMSRGIKKKVLKTISTEKAYMMFQRIFHETIGTPIFSISPIYA